MTASTSPIARYLRNAAILAVLMIGISAGARLASRYGIIIERDLSVRLTMAVLGIFFVLTGNALPKMLTPLSALRCDAGTAQATRRFAGWAWTLAGLAYAIVWLTLPLSVANPASFAVIVLSSLAIFGRAVRSHRTLHPKS